MMSLGIKIGTLALLALVATQPAFAGSATAAKAAAPTESAEGYELYQTSTIKGDFDVFVSSQGVKIFDRKNIQGVVARPPLWDVYSYNNVTRRVCMTPLVKYRGMGHAADDTTGGANLQKIPVKPGAAFDLHGIKAVECKTTPAFEKQQLKDFEREAADPRFVKSAEMLIAEKVVIPAKAATILARFYNVPDFGVLPLQFKFVNLRDEMHTMLLTNSMQPMRTWKHGFGPPVEGYKTVLDPSKLEDKTAAVKTRKVQETVKKQTKVPERIRGENESQ